MKKLLVVLTSLTISAAAYGAGDVAGAVEASVKAIDTTAKKITVKAADGTEHTFRIVGRTTVHGAEATSALASESLGSLKEGSEVVVHYSKRGAEETAEEIDRIGEGGLKETKGTIARIDRGGKKMIVKGDNGVEETYDLSDHAVQDAGKDIAEGSEKGAKVSVYYVEKGGHKVAHFFKAAV